MSQAAGTTKNRLRTAAEVISRLRWCETDEYEVSKVRIGYTDRIHGPMEKCLQDYCSIDAGGDLPEHRIQYFRLDNTSSNERKAKLASEVTILWDKLGRVDKIFGSGNGKEASIPDETLQQVQQAVATGKLLEEERILRKKDKARQRARKNAKQIALQALQATKFENIDTRRSNDIPATDKMQGGFDSFSWEPIRSFEFPADGEAQLCSTLAGGQTPIKFVTWNVLFDIYKIEQINENDSTQGRWQAITNILEQSGADVIALQEVTVSFASFLFEQMWPRERGYAISVGPTDLETVVPFGNIMLWKRQSFQLLSPTGSLFLCRHRQRCRSVVAALQSVQDPSCVLLCANIHLPADKLDWKLEGDENASRRRARKRELGATIGKIQLLEQKLATRKLKVSCVIMGDFNNSEENEFDDGGFLSFFTDSWRQLYGELPGCTFDPKSNVRARKSTKGPRRIDRIYVGSCFEERNILDAKTSFRPVMGELLGCPGAADFIPPSDHYALSVSFKFLQSKIMVRREPVLATAWASNAISNCDSLLALVPDTPTVGMTGVFDLASSLPVPHVTLLHGFVELSSDESRLLATQFVRKAVMDSIGHLINSKGLTLPFDHNSLSVLEHRTSATLVCKPSVNCGEGSWIQSLYQTLCASFRQCHEQCLHSQDGWSPHLSIGTFGSTLAARKQLSDLVSSGKWVEKRTLVSVHSIVLYERSRKDGQFYAVSSVPLVHNRVKEDAVAFLQDAGLSLVSEMRGISVPALFEMERACKAEIHAVSHGELDAKLSVYGSFGLDTALPMLSDIDIVCEISPAVANGVAVGRISEVTGTFDSNQYLLGVAARLEQTHSKARLRIRSAAMANGNTRLHILTGKIWPGAPSVDVLVCVTKNRNPINASSIAAQEAMSDMEYVTRAIISSDHRESSNIMEVFAGAVRLLKLWANRRHIYGSKIGFLGGGGWTVMLAAILLNMDGCDKESILWKDGESIPAASRNLVRYFFETFSRRTSENMIFSLPQTTGCLSAPFKVAAAVQDAKDRKVRCSTIAVIAPVSAGDFGRNMTRSTAGVLIEEMRAAASALSVVRKDNSLDRSLFAGFEDAFQPFRYDKYWALSDRVLLLELNIPCVAKLCNSLLVGDMKAWGCKQILSIVLRLEREYSNHEEKIRPLSSPTKSISGRLLFLIRCPSNISQDFVKIMLTDILLLFQESFPSLCKTESATKYVNLRLATVEETLEARLLP